MGVRDLARRGALARRLTAVRAAGEMGAATHRIAATGTGIDEHRMAVRAGVARSSGGGAERLLDEIAKSVSDDEAWIRSVETCCIVNAGSLNSPHTGVGIRALILLSPHPGPEGARQSASRSRTFSETAP